jgi:hypothetical protein
MMGCTAGRFDGNEGNQGRPNRKEWAKTVMGCKKNLFEFKSMI